MKRFLSALCAAVLLAAMLALPAHAGGEKLFYILETSVPDTLAGAVFTLTVKLRAENIQPAALRFYLLYDSTRFALETDEAPAGLLAKGGMFALRDASGEVNKYPAAMAPAERAKYGVVVVQWASLPDGAALPGIDAQEPTELISIAFRALDALVYPAPGGRFLLSADYGYADTPYFHDIPADTAQADVIVHPIAPIPEVYAADGQGIVLDGDYVYGFDPAMTVQGSVKRWDNSLLAQYFRIENDGVLSIYSDAKPENRALMGTGSQLVLWNATQTRPYESYTVLIFGDLDGNGFVDLDDCAAARALLANDPGGDSPAHLAADVCAPYGAFDAADVQAIYEAAIGKTGPIAQVRP